MYSGYSSSHGLWALIMILQESLATSLTCIGLFLALLDDLSPPVYAIRYVYIVLVKSGFHNEAATIKTVKPLPPIGTQCLRGLA